jgi:hypothetical protein
LGRRAPGSRALGVDGADLGPYRGYPIGRGARSHDLVCEVAALPVALAGEQPAQVHALVLHDDQVGSDGAVKLTTRSKAVRGH